MSALEKITSAPLETRQRWWSEMNCWRTPEDFPIELPKLSCDRSKFEDTEWRAAWNALSDSLTRAEQSMGWWIHQLGKTEQEWRQWWATNGRAA